MVAMTKDETYNGWSNYPTWAVNLWLSNDEGLYNRTLETLEGCAEMWEDSEDRANGREYSAYVAEWLHDFIVEDVFSESFSESSLADDLATWALGGVNWREIAEAWIQTASEQS